jgi:RNA polymerase sigma-70 factor, ECF subfamily
MRDTAAAVVGETRALFEQHGAALYRFATAMLRHTQDAEDVVQETFLKLLQHLEAGGNRDNLRGWLFTVAAHAARDRQRRRSRWLPWTVDHDDAVEPAALPDEDGRQRALRASLRHVSARDRLLLALRAQGLSYREIASAAGVNETSVGQFLARAIERWTRAFEQERGEGHAVSFQRADSGRR